MLGPRALLFACLLLPGAAFAAMVGPWTMGMSEAEVQAATTYGPYRAFSNGDLETYNVGWAGENRNFQFYFTDHKLSRIAVHMYEGSDADAAAAMWVTTHQAMQVQWGALETPHMDPANAATFARQASKRAVARERVQMAPLQQPDGVFVFATLRGDEIEGKLFYAVVINIDPPK